MSFDFTTIEDGLAPILFILGGLVLGILCERVVLRKLRRFAAQTRWESDAIITNALRGMPMLWLLVAGFYGALVSVPVREDVSHLGTKTLLVLLILSASVVAARLAAGCVGLSSRKAGLNQPLYLYFEVYNLAQDQRGRSSYTIEYRLGSVNIEKSFLSRIIGGAKKTSVTVPSERSGRENWSQEYIALDVSELEPGNYRLQVTLKDRNSGATVSRSVSADLYEKR